MSTNRIIKNSLGMYLVMGITTIIGLYNSRIILSTLGVEDFGIYSLVYGLVLLFSFINGSMSGTIQRFFSVSIGKKDEKSLREYINSSIIIHILIAIFVLILSKTIGEWFLLNKMVFSEAKKEAVYIVYQITMISFLLQILSTPAQAILIAYEKMWVTSFISALTSVGKLISILIVLNTKSESNLVFFCELCLIFSVIQMLLFYITSDIISKVNFSVDPKRLKELSKFAFWSFIGDISSVLKNQGTAINLNLFFGAQINAAYGIANQVCGNLNNLSNMLTKAASPKIVMLFNSDKEEQSHKLVTQLSKVSFSLLFVVSIPFLFVTKDVLILWLGSVPDYSIQFTRLSVISALIEVSSIPLMVLSKATGKIKRYQAIVGGVLLLNLPVSYFVLLITKIPESVYYVFIFNSAIALICRLTILKRTANLPILYFIKNVFIKISCLVISVLLCFLIIMYLAHSFTILYMLNVCVILPIFALIFTYTFILNNSEKLFILNMYRKLFNKVAL